MDIKKYIKDRAALVAEYLDERYREPGPSVPALLNEAMRYSLLAGGKRIRPVLAIAAYEACGGRGEDILPCAAALEAIHTYSLIHDDLPAMDNDDLRRGKPTNHKVYGEAMAILAGDGLLTEAFLMILGNSAVIPIERLHAAMYELANAAGPAGMVGGQVQDMLSEGAEPDAEVLQYIHRHKTGALLAASVKMGAILHGTDEQTMTALGLYGEAIGLAFQVVDDILDIRGDEAEIGKPVGSDLEKHKLTYPAVYGMDESMRRAAELVDEALHALEGMDERAEPLREIARYLLRRTS